MKRKDIIGIYLAAGKSKRFGENKLSSHVGKQQLGSLALTTALDSRLDKIVVVTTEWDELHWVSPHLFHSYRKKLYRVPCVKSMYGQSYSLKCGLKFAEALRAEAVMIMLADQPLISKHMINKIIDQYKKSEQPISFIAASCSEVPCPPILFGNNMFKDLFLLEGDKGARYLIRRRSKEGIFIEFTNQLFFFDVDTKEDYLTLLKEMNITQT